MANVNNIIVYRLGSLGDTVVALPCFHLIRRTFPNDKIIILTNKPVSGKAAPAMEVLEGSGVCDAAVSYPVGTRDARELAQVRKVVRDLRPMALINLAAGRGFLKSVRDYLFFRSCGIKRIVGTPLRQRDLHVQKSAEGEYEAESQRLASRLSCLGSLDLADRRLWDLRLSQEERNEAARLLPLPQGNYLAASAGTKSLSKDWGEENWRRLCGMLSKKMPGATLVLIGSGDEWQRSEKLSRAWSGPGINFCGKLAPRISAAIMERCRMFMGHDSGPAHLAGILGIPTLALFSWFNPPGQWFPGHKSWKNIRVLYPPLPRGGWHPGLAACEGPAEGVRLLPPEDVAAAAIELWDIPTYSCPVTNTEFPATPR